MRTGGSWSCSSVSCKLNSFIRFVSFSMYSKSVKGSYKVTPEWLPCRSHEKITDFLWNYSIQKWVKDGLNVPFFVSFPVLLLSETMQWKRKPIMQIRDLIIRTGSGWSCSSVSCKLKSFSHFTSFSSCTKSQNGRYNVTPQWLPCRCLL